MTMNASSLNDEVLDLISIQLERKGYELYTDDFLGEGTEGPVFGVSGNSVGRCVAKLHWAQQELSDDNVSLLWEIASHTNVVNCWAILRKIDGLACDVTIMERGDESLRDICDKYTDGYDRLAAHRLLEPIARQQQVFHDRRPEIHHHDMKPENLLYYQDARAMKIADFGMARTYDRASVHTVHKEFRGTRAYFRAGADAQKVMKTSDVDVFAFVLCYTELRLGRHPYDLTGDSDRTSIEVNLATNQYDLNGLDADEQEAIEPVLKSIDGSPGNLEEWFRKLDPRSNTPGMADQDGVQSATLSRNTEVSSKRLQAAESPVLPRKSTKALLSCGFERLRNKDYIGAISCYDQVIELDPHCAEAYDKRCFIKSVLGDLEGAMLDSNRAIGLSPTVPEYYLNRGTLREVQGDQEGAFADYEEASRLDPTYKNEDRNLASLDESQPSKNRTRSSMASGIWGKVGVVLLTSAMMVAPVIMNGYAHLTAEGRSPLSEDNFSSISYGEVGGVATLVTLLLLVVGSICCLTEEWRWGIGKAGNGTATGVISLFGAWLLVASVGGWLSYVWTSYVFIDEERGLMFASVWSVFAGLGGLFVTAYVSLMMLWRPTVKK